MLAARPTHYRAAAQRARALAAAGPAPRRPFAAARHAADLAPKSHVPLLFLGQIQYDAGACEEARKAFRQAAERDPENQLIQAYLGLTALALGHFEEGAAQLRRHLLFGYERLEARRPRAGRALFVGPSRAGPHPGAATHRGRRGARAPGRRGLRCAPSWPCVMHCSGPWRGCGVRRGWPFSGPRRPCPYTISKGPSHTTRAAEAAGADAREMALAQGMAYYEAGKAQAAAEQLLRLPEEMRARPGGGRRARGALFESGRCEQARPFLTLAAERFRKDFAPAYYRGLCAIALGKDKEAVSWFEQGLRTPQPRAREEATGRDAAGATGVVAEQVTRRRPRPFPPSNHPSPCSLVRIPRAPAARG